MDIKSIFSRLRKLALREVEISRRRPLYLFCMLIAPVFFSFMFAARFSAFAAAFPVTASYPASFCRFCTPIIARNAYAVKGKTEELRKS